MPLWNNAVTNRSIDDFVEFQTIVHDWWLEIVDKRDDLLLDKTIKKNRLVDRKK